MNVWPYLFEQHSDNKAFVKDQSDPQHQDNFVLNRLVIPDAEFESLQKQTHQIEEEEPMTL